MKQANETHLKISKYALRLHAMSSSSSTTRIHNLVVVACFFIRVTSVLLHPPPLYHCCCILVLVSSCRAPREAVEVACAVISQMTLSDEALTRLQDTPNPTLQRLYQVLETQVATDEEEDEMEAEAPGFVDPTLPEVSLLCVMCVQAGSCAVIIMRSDCYDRSS